MKILIIGGGISGLVAACNLQLKGHQTTIIENNFLGGRLNKFKSNETDFCNGPSFGIGWMIYFKKYGITYILIQEIDIN